MVEVLNNFGIEDDLAREFLRHIKDLQEGDRQQVLNVKRVLELEDSDMISLAKTILRVYNES